MAPTKPALLLRLQTRLTVLYAALFAGALVLLSLAVYAAVAGVAERTVRAELTSGATVFDRLWAQRSQQLTDGATLLARDFGFLTAFATNDGPTINSALDSLKNRLGVDQAYVISGDGAVSAATGQADPAAAQAVVDALMADETASGIVMMGDTPYQAVSVPMRSPSGWIVFAVQLDADELRSLESLSAIPLHASVLHRRGGDWAADERWSGAEQQRIDRFVNAALEKETAKPGRLQIGGEGAIALVKPLPSMDQRAPAALVLRYPLARALAPYRALFALIIAVGLVGLMGVVWGSWALARTLTRPITALDDAAQRLQAGMDVEVEVKGDDEVARLGRSFNTMAAGIRARERHITHLALHDGETGLANRHALERVIAGAEGGPVFCAACGIERFAEVRNAIGYALSAELIQQIARRLEETGLCMAVGRLSSDVVGVIFSAEDNRAALDTAARLARALDRPVTVEGATIDVGLSVGLAATPIHGRDAGPVINRASIALDQARAQRTRAAVFNEGLYGDPAANLSLMSELRSAMTSGGVSVHYQPKLDLRSGLVTGAEALVRWSHPERGPLGPDLFIGMAEETGHIRELTEFVLERAMIDQARMAGAGHELSMSVNLSGRLLGDVAFSKILLDQVRSRAHDLCLEITETAIIENAERADALLHALAAEGVGISIDDYGSGLSSLAYLKRIPATELKVDKAFVLDMAKSQRDALLVRSAIDLGHSLGLKVTAEGVEDSMALSLLSVMGCDQAQGFIIARPMPINEFLAYLAQSSASEPVNHRGDEGAQDSDFGGGLRGGGHARLRPV